MLQSNRANFYPKSNFSKNWRDFCRLQMRSDSAIQSGAWRGNAIVAYVTQPNDARANCL